MILQSDILKQDITTEVQKRSDIINEALKKNEQTAFLSHSHKDMELVKRIQNFLKKNGWNVYVDWADNSMPVSTNSDTAKKIKDQIVKLDWFLFLATQNSMVSRWCPWEIGYADGVKSKGSIIIIPTTDHDGKNHGNEYLGLYRSIQSGQLSEQGLVRRKGVAVFEASQSSGAWISELRK